MDVQGFSRETVANATAASGLDLHYAKEREFFLRIFWGPEIIHFEGCPGALRTPTLPFLDEFWHMFQIEIGELVGKELELWISLCTVCMNFASYFLLCV
jgi:hypothetical protein